MERYAINTQATSAAAAAVSGGAVATIGGAADEIKGAGVEQQQLPILRSGAQIASPRIQIKQQPLIRPQRAMHAAEHLLRAAYVVALNLVTAAAADPQEAPARGPAQVGDREAGVEVDEARVRLLRVDAHGAGEGARREQPGQVGAGVQRGDEALLPVRRPLRRAGGDRAALATRH